MRSAATGPYLHTNMTGTAPEKRGTSMRLHFSICANNTTHAAYRGSELMPTRVTSDMSIHALGKPLAQ